MDARKRLGKEGEKLALEYLLGLGLELLAANYRCRLGEIDIILFDKGQIVFVEVRTKASKSFGSGLESITSRKSSKVRAVAQYYLACNNFMNTDIRFDVISIYKPFNSLPSIQHIKGAF